MFMKLKKKLLSVILKVLLYGTSGFLLLVHTQNGFIFVSINY